MIHVLAVRGRNIRSAVEEIYSNKKRFDDITNHRIFQTVDKVPVFAGTFTMSTVFLV
jgi:hypothetical protein